MPGKEKKDKDMDPIGQSIASLMTHLELNLHTCHKLWAEICEIRQNFK